MLQSVISSGGDIFSHYKNQLQRVCKGFVRISLSPRDCRHFSKSEKQIV